LSIFSNPASLLSITGVNVFVGDMIRHITTIDDQLDKITETYAKRIERDAKANVKANSHDTGTLHDSIAARRIDKAEWIIEATAPHSIYIEYGTSKMEPRPFMRPAFDKHVPRYERALIKMMGPVRNLGDEEPE
jgi:HK97 gp10 family phage protein